MCRVAHSACVAIVQLSRLTGDAKYKNAVDEVMEHVRQQPKTDGLVPIWINVLCLKAHAAVDSRCIMSLYAKIFTFLAFDRVDTCTELRRCDVELV